MLLEFCKRSKNCWLITQRVLIDRHQLLRERGSEWLKENHKKQTREAERKDRTHIVCEYKLLGSTVRYFLRCKYNFKLEYHACLKYKVQRLGQLFSAIKTSPLTVCVN